MNPHIHITSGDWFFIVEDLVNSLVTALSRLGYDVTFERNKLHDTALNLNVAANGITVEQFAAVNDRLIHYNLEQIRQGNYQIEKKVFLDTLRTGFVWDYNPQNIHQLHNCGIHHTALVPIGYIDTMSFIQPAEVQDIDVVFYGYETERRLFVLNQLREMGMTVETSQVLLPQNPPWPNPVRNEMISRAKVVFCAHAFPSNNIFEIVRISHLLSNRKAVVTEVTPHTHYEADILPGVVHGSLNQLTALCKLLVTDEAYRKEQEQIGFEVFSKRNQMEYVYNGLGAYYKWRKFQ